MRSSRPDLIVPIRDRRQHRRILTLHNVGTALLIGIVAFVVISVRSEFHRGPTEGDYGRLYHHELPPPPEAKPLEVVQEATPVDDHTAADPMLIAPAVRSQTFIESARTGVIEPQAVAASAAPQLDAAPRRDGHARVAIVGGSNGVVTVANDTAGEKRLLKGGVFRAND